MNLNPLKGKIICVDGPSASGKGTLAKNLARAYRMKFLDTGCVYRAVSLQLLREGVLETDLDATVQVAEKLCQSGNFDFKHIGNNHFAVFAFGEDVTEAIRSLAVGLRISTFARHQPLRLALRRLQQDFANHWRPIYGVVLDGRDTGGKIAPDADLKLMMYGDPKIRAGWRLKDFAATGNGNVQNLAPDLETVAAELATRDLTDAPNMEVFPETIKIDVTADTAAGVFAQITALIKEKFGVVPVADNS